MQDTIIYTAITGNKDNLKEMQNTASGRFVAFTDDDSLNSETWELRKAYDKFIDPNRNAKIYKILSHQFFPEYEYSLWIDGTVTLLTDVSELIRRYLKDSDLAVFKHWGEHQCIYEEAEICKQRKLDYSSTIDAQLHKYQAVGFPRKSGLAECSILLRRHTDKLKKFNDLWWREIELGSRRDQLSFNYIVWKTGLNVNYFPGQIQNDPEDQQRNGNPHFRWERHLTKRELINE